MAVLPKDVHKVPWGCWYDFHPRLMNDGSPLENYTLEQQIQYTGWVLNQLIDSIQGIEDALTNYVDEQLHAYFDRFKQLVDDLKNRYDTLFLDLSNQLSEAVRYLDNKIEHYLDRANYYTNYRIDLLRDEILDYIQNGILVFNPVQGKQTDINTALVDLLNESRRFGITANNYDALHITADEYDQLNVTANDYDRYFGLDMRYGVRRMFSPFTGRMDTYENIINSLADLHKNGLTANEYDALNITANAYDALNITAYQYDWNGKDIL